MIASIFIGATILLLLAVLSFIDLAGFPHPAHIKNDNKTVFLKLDINNII
jgi:hypothetical protein